MATSYNKWYYNGETLVINDKVFKIPKDMTIEEYLSQHLADGDTDTHGK